MTSGRLMAQAATLIRSSPSLGSGTSRVTIFLLSQSCENNYLGRSVLGNVHALHRRGNGGEAAHNA